MTRRMIKHMENWTAAELSKAVPEPLGLGGCRAVARTLAASGVRGVKKTSGVKDVAPGKAVGERPSSAKSVTEPSIEDLNRKLETAELRIKDLEQRLGLMTDRIAWVADSLHSLLDHKG